MHSSTPSMARKWTVSPLWDYKEHAISDGSDSMAVAYIRLKDTDGKDVFGVGVDHNINLAPLRGILSAITRAWKARHQK